MAYRSPLPEDEEKLLFEEVQRVSEVLQKWVDAYDPYLQDKEGESKEEKAERERVLKKAALPEDGMIRGAYVLARIISTYILIYDTPMDRSVVRTSLFL